MTCIDGNAMAKKGRAGAALCIAAIGSWIGGTFGIVVLTVVAPPLATLAVKVGPPEYTPLLILRPLFLPYNSSSSAAPPLLMARHGPAAGHHGHRQHDGPLPLFVRPRRARRRHRHRAGRGRPLWPRRDPVDAEPQRGRRGDPAEAARPAAQPAGMAR